MRPLAQQLQAARKGAITAVLEEFFSKGGQARCPRAEIGFYPDSRGRYLRCQIEDATNPGRGQFPIASNPLGVMMFCCDAYVSCPVWQAEKDRDAVIERVTNAVRDGKLREATQRQIRSGMRVDDASVEDASVEDADIEHLEVKKLDARSAEVAARVNRMVAQHRHEKMRSYV